MPTEHWAQVKAIVQDALERPLKTRPAFVAGACAGNVTLQADVEALLAAERDANLFLADPTRGEARSATPGDTAAQLAALRHALSGRYWIEEELGRGGMGIVYLARDIALDRPVAVKLLPPELAAHQDYHARFLREARTAARLSHPHIVPIHLVEEREDLVYFVMTYVDGESLAARVARAGPLSPAQGARVVQEVAWALAYAHANGVVHRDIKPDNILIERGSGRALVADFGIARLTGTDTVSQQGEVLGTLRYMSPEQATASEAVDGRSDIYSLGITAYFALTGWHPFEADSAAGMIAMHLTQVPPPLTAASPEIPSRFAQAVDRCLAKSPAERFPNAEALAEAVTEAKVLAPAVPPTARRFIGTVGTSIAQAAVLTVIWLWLHGYADNLANPETVDAIMLPFEFLIALLGGITLLRPIGAARVVVRAGLNETDVATAAVAMLSARDAGVDLARAQADTWRRYLRPPWVRAVALVPGILSGLQWVAGFRAWGGGDLPRLLEYLRFHSVVLETLITAGIVWFSVSLAVAPGFVVGVFTGGPEAERLARRVWGGPLVRWALAVAGLGIRRSARRAPAGDPTEALAARAAFDALARLPRALRARLGDVGNVIRGLERAVHELRVRGDELTRAVAETDAVATSTRKARLVSELADAKRDVDHRVRLAVEALDTLRLDLVRLQAGIGLPADLTASIDEARAIGEAVSLELTARRYVERVAAGGDGEPGRVPAPGSRQS